MQLLNLSELSAIKGLLFKKNILFIHKVIHLLNQTQGKLNKNIGKGNIVDGKILVPFTEVAG